MKETGEGGDVVDGKRGERERKVMELKEGEEEKGKGRNAVEDKGEEEGEGKQ